MFFWVKKAIGFLLMPLPFCLLLLLAGICLFRTKRARLGRALVVAGTVLLLLFSNKSVSTWLVRPIEARYPAVPELPANAPLPPAVAACRFVVVLGAGNGYRPGLSALGELSSSALSRITEAVRLLRVLPDAQLIVSGPGDERHESHARVLARAAVSLGLDRQRIRLIEKVRDTEDESLAVRQEVGREPFALVTSAWHMPRTMALFRYAGMNPLPSPADFTSRSDGVFQWEEVFPDVESLNRSTCAVRERIGYAWIWLRGRGGEAPP